MLFQIYAQKRELERLKKIAEIFKWEDRIEFTEHEHKTTVLMGLPELAPLQCLSADVGEIERFLATGRVLILKRCPHRLFGFGKCLGERCQLYLTEGLIGDCSMKWSANMEIQLFQRGLRKS